MEKSRTGFLAILLIVITPACSRVISNFTPPASEADAQRAQPGSAGRVENQEKKSYLYWLPQGSGIFAYQFGAKRPKGVGSQAFGYGLTVDAQGFVYEAFSSDSGSGIAVMTSSLSEIVRTINLPVGVFAASVAVDGKGETYVCDVDTNAPKSRQPQIQVFAPGASGDARPERTIGGSKTLLGSLITTQIIVDADGYQYVANPRPAGGGQSSIIVFAPGAKGNVKPVRQIAGAATGLSNALTLALGADANLYVANQLSNGYDVLVFQATATGDVSPLRILNSGNYGAGIALGTGGELYLGNSVGPTKQGVAVYAAGASGSDQPIAYLPIRIADDPPYAIALSSPWYQP